MWFYPEAAWFIGKNILFVNQSVRKAGAAFVKGAKRIINKKKEKKDKQWYIKNKPKQKGLRTNKPRGELILGWTRSDDNGCVYHHAIRMLKKVEIFSTGKKKKFSNDRWPNPVNLNTPLLVIFATLYQTTTFWTGPNSKHLQTTK